MTTSIKLDGIPYNPPVQSTDKTPEKIHHEICIAWLTQYLAWLDDDQRRIFFQRAEGMLPEDAVEMVIVWALNGMIMDINNGRVLIVHEVSDTVETSNLNSEEQTDGSPSTDT